MRGLGVNYRRRSLRNVPLATSGGNGRARHFNSEVGAARRQSPFPHTHTRTHAAPGAVTVAKPAEDSELTRAEERAVGGWVSHKHVREGVSFERKVAA